MTSPFVASAVSRQDGSSVDGIHLLWTAPPQIGYSIDGFDIQRRVAGRRELECYTLTATELQSLHQFFRVNVPPGIVAFRRTACPEFPSDPPDEPAPKGEEEEPPVSCTDFRLLPEGTAPNPRKEKTGTYLVREATGQPAALTTIKKAGLHTGLDCGRGMEIDLETTVDTVEVTIVHLAQPAKLEALRADNSVASSAAMQAPKGQPETLLLSGGGISRVVISAPQDETLLLQVCLIIESAARGAALTPAASEGKRSRFPQPPFDLHAPQIRFRTSAAAAAQTPGDCVLYEIRLSQPHYAVRITAGLPAMLAIAMREAKAVDTRYLSAAGGLQTAIFENRVVDQVLIYATKQAASLTICFDIEDPKQEDQSWANVPFIAMNIHLPVRQVNPALGSDADERSLASSRLLPGEVFDATQFDEVASLMNDTSANAAAVSPMTQIALTRESQDDPFVELRGWPYSFALLMEADWRRMLGFGYFDKGGGLTPGEVYDYRITGRFRQREFFERLLGFHTVPLDTSLPRWFHLGPVLVETEFPAEVAMFPKPPADALRAAGRKGIALVANGPGGRSLEISFPEPVTQVVIELEPGESAGMHYEARTSDYLFGLSGSVFSGAVPASFRSELQFPEPVDRVALFGNGFFYGIRIPIQVFAGKPDDVLSVFVVIPGVRFEPTVAPDPPPFLGTLNLQQPQLPGDPAITTQQPPQHMGFHLFWLPPPASGTTVVPWPTDLPAFPPFDVTGFHIERRRVDTGGPFEEVDDSKPPTRFFGSRTGRRNPPHLYAGIDLLAVFPEVVEPEPPVSVLMDVEDTLRSLAKPAGPPPGSLHQYRIFSVDAIGRLSTTPTLGSVVRLEKRVPPPQPAGPTTPVPAGVERPVGVSARVLQSLDSRLTASDQALLGASTNAIVLEWAWTQAERDRDPFATEFRVYFRPLPPDLIRGALNGAAAPVGAQWQMSALLDQPITADAIKGRYLLTGSGAFKVASHTAGTNITINFEQSAITPVLAPLAAPIEFPLPPDADELRPARWPERTAVVPITSQENYQFVFRDRLTITATQPEVRVWVGVSAADDQSYIPDEIAAGQPNGGRPGNESSVAAVPANARYLGRPVFVVPPPLSDVPEQVTNEPVNDSVAVPLNLPGLLPAVAVPAGFKVKLERLSADELLNRISARDDDTIGARLPDGSNPGYTLGNPADQAAFLSQIRSGEGVRVEGRFIMDFLTRHLAAIEPLWQSSSATTPVPFAALDDTLPGKSERYVHRIRLVDQAGHVSVGGAIVPQFVRVPTLASPGSPSFDLPGSKTDTLQLSARVRDVFDLKWVVLFTLIVDATTPADETSLEKPQLLRLPNRRDLYPNSGIRLRLADGTLLAPAIAVDVASGTLDVPDRVLDIPIVAGFGKRVSVWAVAMTRDGITSRLIGPRTAFTGAAPLVVPPLTVTSAAGSDMASWDAVSSEAEASLERSTDAGATWTRVTPWLRPSQSSFTVPAVTGARQYRLRLRASQGRAATGPGVAPA